MMEHILLILSNFYNEIKDKLQKYESYLTKEKKQQLLELNFSKKFILTEKTFEGNKIINYNSKTDTYEISISNYEKLLTTPTKNNFSILEINNVLEKYEDMVNNNFSDLELEILIASKQLKADDFIKSQFIHELFLSIVDVRTDDKIKFKDNYGIYSQNRGNYLTKGIVEYLSRKFSMKNNIYYIPEQKYQKISKFVNDFVNEKNFEEFEEEFFNGNIYTISNKLNIFMKKRINDMEIEYFEEEFKIKKGSILEEKEQKVKLKESESTRKESINYLKEMKNKLTTNSISTNKNSTNIQNAFGFVNIIQLLLIITFILIALIAMYLVMR